MSFPFNFFAAAFVAAFLVTLLASALWRRWCVRTGLVDDPGHRKIHDTPVPLAGGLAVLTGILLPIILGVIAVKTGLLKLSFSSLLSHGLDRRGTELGAIALGAFLITLLGWLDDKHELKPLPKFAAQCAIALLVAAGGLRITLFVPHLAF